MSDIKQVISLLSISEQRKFIAYLKERNKRSDTRNTDLFKALTEGKENKIREAIGSNAYNVLKKRLFDRLLDFIPAQIIEGEAGKEIDIIKQLLVARKLLSYDYLKPGIRILYKLEIEAQRIGHYSLLNEIFHTLIEYSHREEVKETEEELFRKLEVNNREFIDQERLNAVYAAVRKAFKTVEQGAEQLDLEAVVRENFKKYNISMQQGVNFQSLYQLAMITDIAGAHSRRYHSSDLFFIDKIAELKGGDRDTEKFLLYHIDLLYSVANIYFRKRQFEQSQQYLDEMLEQMERFNRKYYKERYPKYVTLKALNYNFTGDYNEALHVLQELYDWKQFEDEELLQAKLTETMILFQQGEVLQVKQIFSSFYRTDAWYERTMGKEWLLQLKFMEILLHIELGNTDYADSRIASIKRKYKDDFKTEPNNPVLPFLQLIQRAYQFPGEVVTPEFKERVERSIPWRENKDEEDIFFMCFYAWLKAKMERASLYDTTLELVTPEA